MKKENESVAFEKMEVTEEEDQRAVVQLEMGAKPSKTPLHANRVIYLPYLPLSIHRSTVETVSFHYLCTYLSI